MKFFLDLQRQYQSVANEYDQTLEFPYRKHVEIPTTCSLIGDVRLKHALDLACGTGCYTRYLRSKGAFVYGVDISAEMIRIAKNIELKHPLGIQYFQQNVLRLNKIGDYDLITAIYLFHYFSTEDQLIRCCQNISMNLKNKGRFLTYVLNPDFKNENEFYTKYGFDVYKMDVIRDGAISAFSFNNSKVKIDNYYWSKKSIEKALRMAGFKIIKWIGPTISDEGIQRLGRPFWEDYLEYPRLVHIEAIKC